MTHLLHHKLGQVFRAQEGSSLIETAFALPFMVLLLVGAIDFGRAFYVAIEVQSSAEAGALYGLQNVTNTAGMQAAAKLDAADVSGLTAVATYGCECSDGSSAKSSCSTTPTCSNNIVNYVQVVSSVTYTPILSYPGISSIPLSSTVKLRASQ